MDVTKPQKGIGEGIFSFESLVIKHWGGGGYPSLLSEVPLYYLPKCGKRLKFFNTV